MVSINAEYKYAAGFALAAVIILTWMMLGIGISGVQSDSADLLYVGVIVVACIGALLARFRAKGMARALWVTAVAQALVAAIVFYSGRPQASGTPGEAFLGGNMLFVMLWAGSALLFRQSTVKQGSGGSVRQA